MIMIMIISELIQIAVREGGLSECSSMFSCFFSRYAVFFLSTYMNPTFLFFFMYLECVPFNLIIL